jgi:hypothetical protein
VIDAGRKIEREMRRDNHDFHCIVFVRNDVYDHLMKSSSDYGKESRAALDWNDPDMLREMLRLRLATFRRKNEVCGCCARIARGMENCKVGPI